MNRLQWLQVWGFAIPDRRKLRAPTLPSDDLQKFAALMRRLSDRAPVTVPSEDPVEV
jgi:hypothetical protein